MRGQNFINNDWVAAMGNKFISKNPATGEKLWEGNNTNKEEINKAIAAAENAFPSWATLTFEERAIFLQNFSENISDKRKELTEIISKEVGKPLWESDNEVSAVIQKLPISIEAYQDRCRESTRKISHGFLTVRHKPHGMIGVLGPFNFPLHLPMGHIIPALLAGNTVVFKPSELTPLVAEKLFECFAAANFPAGVINLIQGEGQTGSELTKHPKLRGLFFTGSYRTGHEIAKSCLMQPEKILALEMGGNNPLVVHEVSNIKGAIYQTIQSAYITSGQRCTCARRLIVTKGTQGRHFIDELIKAIQRLKVGPYTDQPEPFMGPLISTEAAEKVITSYEKLLKSSANPLVPLKRIYPHLPFLSPSLIDVTSVANRADEEIFGPLLQLVWVNNFKEALQEANNTAYGLAAGLFCEDRNLYEEFLNKIKAGVINWNKALTGASSQAPFGGIGQSGNYRPGAYYAADYCAYPVASLQENTLQLPDSLSPGINL